MAQPTGKNRNKDGYIAVCVSATPYILLLFTAFTVFTESTDDPFITFRYAANMIAGHGPVFNIGERVEGFSSWTHLMLSVGLIKLAPTLGILFKAKLLSLVFALLLLAKLHSVMRQLRFTLAEIALGQSILALNINYSISAVNGLETTLYTYLLMEFIASFLRELPDQRCYRSSYILVLCLATRPETLFVFAVTLIIRVLYAKQAKVPAILVTFWTLGFALPALSLFLIRYYYYHDLLPNTYYAKQVPAAFGLREGVEYLFKTVSPLRLQFHDIRAGRSTLTQSLQLVLSPCYWLLAILGAASRRSDKETLLFGAVIAAFVLFVLRTGGDWMDGWRFMIPMLPFLTIFQCYGIRRLEERIASRTVVLPFCRTALAGVSRLLRVLVCLVFALGFIVAPHAPWTDVRFSTQDEALLEHGYSLGKTWVTASNFIRSTVPSGDTIAYSEMGYACYENLAKRFIDTRGLTDLAIARLAGVHRYQFGVTENKWYVPGNPLYNVLEHKRPDVILSLFMPTPLPVLRGYTPLKSDGWRVLLLRQNLAAYVLHHDRQPFAN